MRTIWHSLAWKEWHEHKWKLASIVGVLCGVTALAMLAPDTDRFGLAFGMLFLGTIPLAVFVGLGTAASERSGGTLPFLQALPVPLWQVAVTKLVMGSLTVGLPVILTVASFYLWRLGFNLLGIVYPGALNLMPSGTAPFGLENWYLDVAVFCACIAGSLFLWSAAAGVNRKDEISAGAVALAVMVGWSAILWFILWVFAFGKTDDDPGVRWLVTITLSTAPGGIALLSDPGFQGVYRAVGVGIVAIVHLLLAARFIQRFGQIADREIVSPQVAVRDRGRPDWLAPPRQSQFAAIAWKQIRESGPIALAGMALIVGISVLLFVTHGQYAQLAHLYGMVSVTLGVGTALVIGIGLVLNDLSPRLNMFWRSRPINADLLFWTKFPSGLMVLLAAIYVPLLLVAAFSKDPVYDPDAMIVAPALHIAAFAAAVAMTTLVRHAVYAAILSIAVLYFGILTVLLAWTAAGYLGWAEMRPNWWEPSETSQFVAGLLLTFVVSTFVAWQAVRNDWGRKSRY